MPMVVARELDELVAPGESACETDGRHGRLGARRHHADFLDVRHDLADLIGELELGLARGAVGHAALELGAHGGQHVGIAVPEDHRPP